MKQNQPVIVALDLSNERAVRQLVERLDPALCRLKVGKELFTAVGPDLVKDLVRKGYQVFLDLKFHDIPHTVAAACRVAADLGVWMVDVHACGGPAMLEAARSALDGSRAGQTPPLLVAITVLTSFNQHTLNAIGMQGTLPDAVLRLAGLAHDAGLDGVVCSAAEAGLLRTRFTAPFLLVTPGIRLPGAPADDQVRIVTPQEACAAGADFLVIGRPITGSTDPRATVQMINAALQETNAS